MRKQVLRFFGMFILMIGLTVYSPVMGQSGGDPPEPPGQHGETGNQPAGGGAPIGEGFLVLSLLGAGYGARKWYIAHKQTLAE